MADLTSDFAGIKSPNPFWLASAPPTDKEYNVVRAFKAGWGGVVWKTLGEDPPIVNVAGPRYGAIHAGDRRLIGLNNIELITDRPLDVNLQRDQAGQARLAGSRPRRLADGAVRGAELEEDPEAGRGHRLRRRRAEFRLPARHERARHGRRRRPGAGIHRDGRALVQAVDPHAGHRQADAQHHRHPPPGPRRQGRRRRRRLADQHHQLDHQRRSRRLRARADHRRQGLARRLLRPGGEADRLVDGLRDRPRQGSRRHPDLRHRRHHHLARRGRVHGARRRQRAGLHRRHDLRLPHRRGDDRPACRAISTSAR